MQPLHILIILFFVLAGKNKSCKSGEGSSESSEISLSSKSSNWFGNSYRWGTLLISQNWPENEGLFDAWYDWCFSIVEYNIEFMRWSADLHLFTKKITGRREVFDGTVQNMHLHWKHRELVKIIVRGKSFAQVKHIAISLEAESEGVLISLDKTTKGYAIIFYRGKNYRRPKIMKPRNLLTRRQALARSIELQRREVTPLLNPYFFFKCAWTPTPL